MDTEHITVSRTRHRFDLMARIGRIHKLVDIRILTLHGQERRSVHAIRSTDDGFRIVVTQFRERPRHVVVVSGIVFRIRRCEVLRTKGKQDIVMVMYILFLHQGGVGRTVCCRIGIPYGKLSQLEVLGTQTIITGVGVRSRMNGRFHLQRTIRQHFILRGVRSFFCYLCPCAIRSRSTIFPNRCLRMLRTIRDLVHTPCSIDRLTRKR